MIYCINGYTLIVIKLAILKCYVIIAIDESVAITYTKLLAPSLEVKLQLLIINEIGEQ